ncbi:MAG: DUF402 domain-containing protein [Lachnospirales bacterium]
MKLYRKRYVPEENVLLKDDVIKYIDENIISTTWKTLKPRDDFNNGRSIIFLNDGYKVSEFYKDNELLYVYCDIINVEKNDEEIIFTDLLVDVVIKDGIVKVLDIDEISTCLLDGTITKEIAAEGLQKLHCLLEIIYNNKLDTLLDNFKHI